MRFSVKIVEVLVFLVFFALFSSLGAWQLQRADQKRDIENQINARRTAPVLSLNRIENWIPEEIEYQRISVSGVFLSRGQLLIDNIVVNAKPGYHVMSPFKIDATGQIILINRGWVSLGRSRAELPKVSLPQGRQTIEGIIRTPSALPFFDAAMVPLSMDAPFSVWLYADLEKYQRETGFKLLPFSMLQTNDNKDGLQREWLPYQAKVAMHIGYAIQWFAFALIVTIIFFGLGRKRGKQRK